MKPVTFNLFSQGEDLPLFNGTTESRHAQTFTPQSTTAAPDMFGSCPVCKGTKTVTVKGRTAKCMYCQHPQEE